MAHLFALSCIICITLASSAPIDPDWKTFTDLNESNYATLLVEVHNVTGDVYMASHDNLYHLDADLVLKKKVVTGPQMVCKTPVTTCESMVLTHNVPHALKIVYHLESHYLMLCGSLYDGRCQLRLLHDLDQVFWIGPHDDPVARSTQYKGDPAFFGPGYGNQIVLYSGTDHRSSNDTGDPLPFFSSKVLVQENGQFRFKYSYQSDSSMSAIFFKSPYKQILIYSFTHGSYVYFLFVRILVDAIQTVLARICIGDGTFTSYIEQRLACGFEPDFYNAAFTAFFGPGFEKGQPVEHLYVAFNKENSLICDFSITILNRLFDTSVEDCFGRANHTYRLNIETADLLKCHIKPNLEDSDFCGSSVNPYIYNKQVAVSIPSIKITLRDFFITSIAVFEENKRIVGFVGSKHSIYTKVLLDGPAQQSLLHASVTDGERIQSSVAFDLKQEHIYFLSYNRIIKYPIRTCSIHKTCTSCFNARSDPLKCGWCDGRCVQQQECTKSFSRNLCSPSIHSVRPLIGSTQGGTHLTIVGKNFGTQSGLSTFNAVHINNVDCSIILWEIERVMCVTGPSPTEAVAPVVLVVRDNSNRTLDFTYQGSAESNQSFLYVTTKLKDIVPDRGSIAGGTKVTIFGTNLDIGKAYTMNIHGRICTDLKVEKFFATCITGKSVDPNLKDVIEMKIDNIYIVPDPGDSDPSKVFQYLPDPEIYRIQPNATVLSFRGNLTLNGRYMNNAKDPVMLVSINSSKGILQLKQKCWHKPRYSGTVMLCSMPVLDSKKFTFPKDGQPLVAKVNFSMFPFKENFPELKLAQLSFYPEPEFQEVEAVLDNQTSLEIKGKYPGSGSLAYVTNVRIGESEPCKISELTSDTLLCEFRPELLTNASVWGKNLSVMVSTGSSHHHVGYLVIKELKVEDSVVQKKSWLIILASVLVLSLLLVAAIVAWWCFRRRRQDKSPTSFLSVPSAVMFRNDYRPNPIRPQAESATSPEDTAIKQPLIRTFSRQPSATAATSLMSRTPPAETNIPETSPIEAISHPGYLGMGRQQDGTSVPYQPSESTVERARREKQHDTTEETMSLDETLRMLDRDGWIIPKEHLILCEAVGAGHHGCVLNGKYNCPKYGIMEVAVKTIRDSPDLTRTTVKEFLDEGVKMKNFKHEHVLHLIGISFDDRVPMIVLPFMQNGDLCSYLRSIDNDLWNSDLLRFATQVAAGMAYLSKEKFVHRDLAARNCLIASDMNVKVADFGLSRDIYESDYYHTETKNRKLPYRWMAPECIELERFTVKSDVWSYGIVLWEIMTRGVLPYEELHHWSMLDFLKADRRLSRPQYCSENLYRVMRSCWEYEPSKRPSFEVIHGVVQRLWTSASYKDRIQSVGAQNRVYCNLE